MYSFSSFQASNSQHLQLSQMLMALAWGECDYASEDFIRWQYLLNPDGEAFGEIVLSTEGSGSGLACQYLTIPNRLWCPARAQQVTALLSVNTATHPAHRKKGLFIEAASRTFERADEAGFDSVFGFPNDSSLPGFLKLGFRTLEPLQLFVAIRRPLRAVTRAVPIIKQRAFPPLNQGGQHGLLDAAEFEKVTSAICARQVSTRNEYLHVPRDPAWLYWRYLRHPRWRYSFYLTEHALFVTRFMSLGDITVAILLDIIGDPTTACVRLLRQFLTRERPVFVCGVFSQSLSTVYPRVKDLFHFAVPFFVSPKNFHVIYLPLRAGTPTPTKSYFSLGDFDLY